jgi:diadenosine tetraphosphate (Ap4A) HIT family hydrolase
VHVLVIPKGEYISQADFGAKAPPEMIVGFWRAVSKIANDLGLDPEGYRLVANHGPNGGQLVFHFHVHIFGGRTMSHAMGSMPSPGNAG